MSGTGGDLDRHDQTALVARSSALADLLLCPPVSSYSVFDPKPIDDLVELGYRAMIEQEEVWRRRLGSGLPA